MGYFDGLVDGIFKKDSTGKNVFYPWGILGSGYVIESYEDYIKIRNSVKKFTIFSLLPIIIIQPILGILFSILFFPIFTIVYLFYLKRITSGLHKTSEKLSTSEAYTNSAKSHNLPTLIFFEIFSILGVIGGFLFIKKETFFALAAIVLFGACIFVFGYMIHKKISR